jgi:hypothetical protein
MLRPLHALIPLLVILACCTRLQAQQSKSDSANYPRWVKMMDDPNVNFFEIEKEFNDFWQGKVLPIEENEIMNEKENSERKRKFFLGTLFKKKADNDKEDGEKYAFEYKKYQWWRRQVLPYVQPDGRILSTAEQVEIVSQQRQLQKQVKEKKNNN